MTRKIFERYELNAFIGNENLEDFDIEGIIEDATEIEYKNGNRYRYWRDGIDLAEICEKHARN